MKQYFIKPDEKFGTLYHEFYKGKWKNDFWNKDSICIHDDDLREFLVEIIKRILPDYDYYGVTEITLQQWQIMKDEALSSNNEAAVILAQAEEWVTDNFKRHNVFTILGI